MIVTESLSSHITLQLNWIYKLDRQKAGQSTLVLRMQALTVVKHD